MNIFIGKGTEGEVYGLILAKSKDIAETFFQAKYGGVYSIEEIDISKLEQTQPFYNLIQTEFAMFRTEWKDLEGRRVLNRK